MAKSKKDTTTPTKATATDNKKRQTMKPPAKTPSTIVEKLRQQSPAPANKRLRSGSSKVSESHPPAQKHTTTILQRRNTSDSNSDSDSDSVTLFQPDYKEANVDNESVDTEAAENLQKDLYCTRVDIKIKVLTHTNPEEQTVLTLQKFLRKLQYFDPKVQIAPWHEDSRSSPLATSSDITPRPSELEKYFPRIFFKSEGFTWYSGARIIHSIPIQDLRKDMIRWMKQEGHGMFERMLQVAETSEVGWLVYSTWQMEADVLAQAIEDVINIPIGLRWKQINMGTKEKLPLDQQVKALHIEVASENRTAAQKALLATYGRRNTGAYPNGIRMRFALPLHTAHNLNAKTKLERLRARQQVWTKTYDKGFSWEITQLDHPVGNQLPTLRQSLLSIMSKTNPAFPLFHSIDRSNYRESGVCFQFLPEMANEARMMISNLVPMMQHAYGEEVLQLFSTSAIERMDGCQWDPEKEMVIGMFDEEITYLDEADPMKDMLKEKSTTSEQSTKTASTSTPTEFTGNHSTSFSPPPHHFAGLDDDSVSTIGNTTHQRWIPSTQDHPPLAQRPTTKQSKADDKSTGSVSTLTTRLTTMEVQYQQISGDVQDIKNMLAVLARSPTQHSVQDEAPTNDKSAGQGSTLTGEGS